MEEYSQASSRKIAFLEKETFLFRFKDLVKERIYFSRENGPIKLMEESLKQNNRTVSD